VFLVILQTPLLSVAAKNFLISFIIAIITALLIGWIIASFSYRRNSLAITTVSKVRYRIDPIPVFIGAIMGVVAIPASIDRGMFSWETIFPKLWYILACAGIACFIDIMHQYGENQDKRTP
jgi:hypothetical protein